MTLLGRKHRPYYRIVAIDSRQPRDGRYLEELGTYDPMVKNTDERVRLKPERIKHWLSVGARPSEKVAVFFKKYMAKFEQQEAAAAAPTLPPSATATPSEPAAPLARMTCALTSSHCSRTSSRGISARAC
jgi:small subunit ribosomal protein S16